MPDWAQNFCPSPVESGHKILLKKAELSFLENFLIDAEVFWEQDESKKPSTINLECVQDPSTIRVSIHVCSPYMYDDESI